MFINTQNLVDIDDNVEIDVVNAIPEHKILVKEMMNGVRENGIVRYTTHCAQLSRIWSKIIEAAGRFTPQFSSDIFTSYERLCNEFAEDGLETMNYLFAFREQGIDGLTLFKDRVKEDPNLLRYGYYRRIYLLSINKEDDPDRNMTILTLTLSDITP